MIPIWLSIPFVSLLLAIAVLPLVAPHFWESNRNKGLVAALVSLPVLFWFLRFDRPAIFHAAVEYFSFICLLGSLYAVSGGIAVSGDLRATPKINTAFLAVGALLANIIGTTGASMVLIRSFLKTNSERKITGHMAVFFIFIVSNCGGLLTPLGDPPLFLGYLRGVPFFWTLRLFPVWLLMNSLLLLIFYFWDRRAFGREIAADVRCDRAQVEPVRISGLVNLVFLAGIVFAVFQKTPVREGLMFLMVVMSFVVGKRSARRFNKFTWGPIVEVAVIFAGIFATMVPALLLLKQHAPELGIARPWQFFWLTGLISSFLDNAPTYLTFYSIAEGIGISDGLLEAISVGAVFMGANTYIGNGPNFMVKAIADRAGFRTPSFFGFMAYSGCILFPLYLLIHLIFF